MRGTSGHENFVSGVEVTDQVHQIYRKYYRASLTLLIESRFDFFA